MKLYISSALFATAALVAFVSCSSAPAGTPARTVAALPAAAPVSVAGKTFVYYPQQHECLFTPDCDNPAHLGPYRLTWQGSNHFHTGGSGNSWGYRYERLSATDAVIYWSKTYNERGCDVTFHLHFTSPTSGTVTFEWDGSLTLSPLGQSGSGTFTLQ